MAITINKKAYHDYEVLKTFESGIVLTGPEVKSIKNGRVNIKGGYAYIDSKKTPWLINVHVDFYPPAITYQIQNKYEPKQNRKLLLRKKEINYLIGKLNIKGLSLIPLKIFLKNNLIKVELGLVKGKKKKDKREDIKKRETKRKIERALKQKIKNS
jgi:SsrA-binding protein